jgi:hypothetical protein
MFFGLNEYEEIVDMDCIRGGDRPGRGFGLVIRVAG